MNKQELFNHITTTRKEKGITQLKLSELVGIGENTLVRNLKGENEMSLDTFLKICKVLDLKLTIN